MVTGPAFDCTVTIWLNGPVAVGVNVYRPDISNPGRTPLNNPLPTRTNGAAASGSSPFRNVPAPPVFSTVKCMVLLLPTATSPKSDCRS